MKAIDQISLKEVILKIKNLWVYLFSKWVLIFGVGILGGLIGFTYSYFKKPYYIARTTFVLEDEKSTSGLGNLVGLASMAGVDLGGTGGGIFQGDNILGLYKSRSMLEQTLLTQVQKDDKRLLLVDIYIDFNNLKEKWAKNNELANLKFSEARIKGERGGSNRLKDSVLGTIVADLNKNYLTVTKPDKKLSTIVVDITSKNEFFAKTFNDELVKNVNEFYTSTKTKKTLKNVQILQHKTDSVRFEMNGAIYSAVAVADATPNLNPTRQVQRVAPAQRSQFSAETNKLILAEMVKNLELSKIALLREMPLIQVVDRPVYPLETDKLGKIKAAFIGCVLFGFLFVSVLVLRKFYKSVINE